MENLIKYTIGSYHGKVVRTYDIEHPDCNRVIHAKKTVLSKKTEKNYKVTVTYIQVTAIIESIIKKGYKP
ncbi:hypothetical protein FA048_03610 [Pedobacter polaris]|uniref:Uncharacterized protein n=1 Tax=Pedobacter polaris TaxID=2571273 RepID=A0A4U1CU13_9SPHI|nr:hypothetical protein [Pedobacter polaris]TKC12717.1 hypothetical protein FA048_03610 [Pedobacter polaris]